MTMTARQLMLELLNDNDDLDKEVVVIQKCFPVVNTEEPEEEEEPSGVELTSEEVGISHVESSRKTLIIHLDNEEDE